MSPRSSRPEMPTKGSLETNAQLVHAIGTNGLNFNLDGFDCMHNDEQRERVRFEPQKNVVGLFRDQTLNKP